MKRFLVPVLALAAGLLAPAAVVAHEGHDHKTQGTVSAIHENHLEVKDAKGKLTTFALEPTTKIRRATAKAGCRRHQGGRLRRGHSARDQRQGRQGHGQRC